MHNLKTWKKSNQEEEKEGHNERWKSRRAGVNFINVLHTAFALIDPESVKNTVKSSVSFYTFGIYEHKSCM